MEKQLRAIQIGIGGIGHGHFRRLFENPRFKVVACCDAFPERTDVKESMALAEKNGVPFFTDFRLPLRKFEADVALICTPHHWHAPMTVAALERGLHVFVEKPATVSVEDARKMVAAQRKARKVVTVGFSPVASADCIALKNHIARGDLGEIREVVAVVNWYRADDYYRRADWVGRKRMQGKWCKDGVIYNQASHTMAAALMLANTNPGPAFSVGKKARAGLYRVHPVETLAMEDLGCAVIDLDGPGKPRLCFYATTCNTAQKGITWVKVFGDKGCAMLGAPFIERRDGTKLAVKMPANVPGKHDNLYEAITRGATPFGPLKEGVKATYTIEKIYEAARNRIRKINRDDLGDLNEIISRSAAQRCLFSELAGPPAWA